MQISRRFTREGQDPFASLTFAPRTSKIVNPNGSVVFEMKDVMVPAGWSQVAVDILAQKYFRCPAHKPDVSPSWSEKLDRVQSVGDSPDTYPQGVASMKCEDELVATHQDLGPEEEQEFVNQLPSLLQHLSSREASLCHRYFIGGFRDPELAALFELPLGTVREVLATVVARFRAIRDQRHHCLPD